MRKLLLAGLPVLTSLLFASSAQRETQTVDRVYDAEGIKVEGLGACSITSETISCWDMAGQNSPSLTATLNTRLSDRNNQALQFRFGKKNRFLVTRMTTEKDTPSAYPQAEMSGFELDQFVNDRRQRTWLSGIAAEPTESTGSLTFSINGIPGPDPVKLSAQKGATVKFGDATYEFGAANEVKPDPKNGNMPILDSDQQKWGKTYAISIGIQGIEEQIYKTFAVTDKAGKPIRFVDAKGKVVSPLDYLQENPNANDYDRGGRNGKYRAATIAPGNSGIQGAMLLYTNIDPTQIDSIAISGARSKMIKITGYPLDPK